MGLYVVVIGFKPPSWMLFDNLPMFIRSSDGDLCHEASVMGGVERRSSFTCWMGKVKLYEPCQIGTETLQVKCIRLCSVRCHFEKHPNHPRVEDFRQAGGKGDPSYELRLTDSRRLRAYC